MFGFTRVKPAPEPCAACAAKDQTILLLGDVIDWHRAQAAISASPASPASPAVLHPAEWYSEAEEEIIAALEDGTMDNEAAERAFALIQAQQTQLH